MLNWFKNIALIKGLDRQRNQIFLTTYAGREREKWNTRFDQLCQEIESTADKSTTTTKDALITGKSLLATSTNSNPGATSESDVTNKRGNNEQRFGDSGKKRQRYSPVQGNAQSGCAICLWKLKVVKTNHSTEECRLKGNKQVTDEFARSLGLNTNTQGGRKHQAKLGAASSEISVDEAVEDGFDPNIFLSRPGV